MKQAQPYLVGIAGGSGSGKTSFLRELMNHYTPEEVALVSQDNYYHPKEKQIADDQGILNFDLPTSIDRQHFHDDMMKLISGETIEKLEYNFNNPEWKPETVLVNPAPVIIMEGLFVFHYHEIRHQLNYMVYLDVHHDERLKRRIDRDGKERGFPEDQVRYQWFNHVRPAEEKYLDPYMSLCDLIVDNNEHYREGLVSLVNTINKHLNRV
ncbi:MAG: uridine kinase [Flavobacteriales bacterium]|nr:uridine kinase [Flavobacteriales bacterium]